MRIQILVSILYFFTLGEGQAQDSIRISNQNYFDSFFDQEGQNLLLLGENHASSVASTIYPDLIKSFNKKAGLTTLMIEFGPAEAYFYNKYLATGDESLLGYTIYGGFYSDWKEAWKEIYEYNQTLDHPLEVVGVDFDRTRTFGYTLYSILQPYQKEGLTSSIDSLLNVIRSDKFFKTYTIDHPSEEGRSFVRHTKKLLEKEMLKITATVSERDLKVISLLMNNKATGFGGTREEDITENIVNYIDSSDQKNFLMLVGRDHAYIQPIYDDRTRLAKLLKREHDFTTLSGLILHENSEQWGKGFKETITLFEVKDKKPWKNYHKLIYDKMDSDFSLIELNRELKNLAIYTDYILVARNQEAIKI